MTDKRKKRGGEPATDSRPDLASFESELGRLEEAVQRLEGPDLTLEEAFKNLEAGSTAFANCRRILDEARARVEVLTARFPDEEPSWQPLEWRDRAEGDGGSEG